MRPRQLQTLIGATMVVVATGCSMQSDLVLRDAEIAALKREVGLSVVEIEALRGENAAAEARVLMLENELRSLGVEHDFTVELHTDADGARNTVLRLPEVLLFAPGRAEIRADGRSLITQIGERIAQMPGYLIRVEGHADAFPVRSGSTCLTSNWELSSDRAIQVVRALLDRFDIDPADIEAVGCGEHRPLASNATPEGRAQNRRVEIHLMPPPLVAELK